MLFRQIGVDRHGIISSRSIQESPPQRPRKLAPAERRNLVALGIQAGKSNRMIAQELGVDEGTIRSDRKALGVTTSSNPTITRRKRGATLPRNPASQPIKVAKELPRTTGIRVAVPKKPSRVPSAVVEQRAAAWRRRLETIVSVASDWLAEQQLGKWSTNVVLEQASDRLHSGRALHQHIVRTIPQSPRTASENPTQSDGHTGSRERHKARRRLRTLDGSVVSCMSTW